MKRRLLIALLGFGTVVGFGSGFASVAACGSRHAERRQAFEQHVADICVDAARRGDARRTTAQTVYVYEGVEEAAPPPGPRRHRHHHGW